MTAVEDGCPAEIEIFISGTAVLDPNPGAYVYFLARCKFNCLLIVFDYKLDLITAQII